MYCENETEILQDLLYDTSDVSFEHVCGYCDAKECLTTYIQASLTGENIQRPVLLYGHPGVGKTLLLRAAAAEARVKLLLSSLYLMRSHVNSKTISEGIKTAFSIARKNRPCIVCFEDVHVLWGEKKGFEGGAEEFLSQLQQHQDSKVSCDGERSTLAIIAVSSRPWLLNPEVTKRFQTLHIGLPSRETCREMILFHLKDVSHRFKDSHLHEFCEKMKGFTGSDICCLVRDAAMHNIRKITKAKFFKKISVPAKETKTEERPVKRSLPEATNMDASTVVLSSVTRGKVQETTSQDQGEERQCSDQNTRPLMKFTPCQETDEGATEMSLWDLDPKLVHCPEPQVTCEGMMAALARASPTISAQEHAKMVDFRDRFQS